MSYGSNTNKSRCVSGTKNFVHDFLDDPSEILRIKLEGKGKASFKVVDSSWYVAVGDYILTKSKDRSHKVIYQIIEVDPSRKIKVGIMEDLCALDKIDKYASAAILQLDPDAQEEQEEINCYAGYM